MKNYLLFFLAVLASIQLRAQSSAERSIDVFIGYGMSVPYDDVEFYGEGFLAQGEYVFNLSRWADIRPYAGVILTGFDEDATNLPEPDNRSTAKAFLFGGKARVSIPILWVAPYLEAGLGGSIGSFETVTPNTKRYESGVLPHIPFSLGLELGPRHNFNFGVTYYFHPRVRQFVGATAIGLSIPL